MGRSLNGKPNRYVEEKAMTRYGFFRHSSGVVAFGAGRREARSRLGVRQLLALRRRPGTMPTMSFPIRMARSPTFSSTPATAGGQDGSRQGSPPRPFHPVRWRRRLHQPRQLLDSRTASISAWVNIHGFTGPTNNFFVLTSWERRPPITARPPSSRRDGSVLDHRPRRAGRHRSLHTAPGIVPADNKWHSIIFRPQRSPRWPVRCLRFRRAWSRSMWTALSACAGHRAL